MANLYKKTENRRDPKTGEKVKRKSKKWWGRYRDATSRERRVPLAADKAAAQAMLNELVRKSEREAAGLFDPTDEQRKRPLADHLKEFESYLKNKDVTPKQVKEAMAQLRKMVAHCNWKLIGDLSASDALNFLGQLRANEKSAQTYNHYLKAVKQFTRWLVRDRRMVTDPLGHLARLNVKTDRRHDRRALTAEEFERLITAARTGPPVETIPGARPGNDVRPGRLDRLPEGRNRIPHDALLSSPRRPADRDRGGQLQQAPAAGHANPAPRSR